jgi:hypothetical protein
LDTELEVKVLAAGFTDLEITWRADIYAGAPQQPNA